LKHQSAGEKVELTPQNPNFMTTTAAADPGSVTSLDKALQLAQAKLQVAKAGRTTSDSDIPVYAPGQYISCTSAAANPVYHAEGWHEPEPEYTWIDGAEAVIRLLVRRPRKEYVLSLDVVPNGACASADSRPQLLEVFFNYFRLAALEVPEAMKVSIEIPAELFILRVARLSLYCPHACVSSDPRLGNRRLGIAVKGWCLH
jgi:hypothetical protein